MQMHQAPPMHICTRRFCVIIALGNRERNVVQPFLSPCLLYYPARELFEIIFPHCEIILGSLSPSLSFFLMIGILFSKKHVERFDQV